MTTKGFDKLYLDDAMSNLGDMFEYASLYSNDFPRFFSRFLVSGIQSRFSHGDPSCVVGLSGKDLADLVTGCAIVEEDPVLPEEKSAYYWCGWAYAYLAWSTGRSIKYLVESGLGLEKMLDLYPTLHEADVTKLEDVALRSLLSYQRNRRNQLKTIRKSLGLTQVELAEKSGVSLRMIRAYEQGSQQIEKAEYSSVLALSKALGCMLESLAG